MLFQKSFHLTSPKLRLKYVANSQPRNWNQRQNATERCKKISGQPIVLRKSENDAIK